MLLVQNISYAHPDKEVLFDNITFNINRGSKVALIGNNGSGKSTLLRILAGVLKPSSGAIQSSVVPYYVPQHFGQFGDLTVAQALRVEDKLRALEAIVAGNDLEVLDVFDDWSVAERCREALDHWGLTGVGLDFNMGRLSGGEKTKVFLAGILVHQPELALLDEPSNHLDVQSRSILYDYVRSAKETIVLVSHDRTLLNLMGTVCSLGKQGVSVYGGNYDFYVSQKEIALAALSQELLNKEKELRKAKETEREMLERRQRLDARGRKKQEKAGLPTISLNTFKNNAEKSSSRSKETHAEKVGEMSAEVDRLRKEQPDRDKMKLDLDNSALHTGKTLVKAEGVNFGYGDRMLFGSPLSFLIKSGERIVIKGGNGSGKTSLIRLILGSLVPLSGCITRAEFRAIYIDQDYSLIDGGLSVYQQADRFNSFGLPEHEVKSKLNHFLFLKDHWDRPCAQLSGGEKMRLLLCCMTIGQVAPDMIVLDEPTNNLDIQNVDILTSAIVGYAGTLIVVSHDAFFLGKIGVSREISLTGV